MSSEKEVKEVEMEEPKPRGYWSSSSRRESSVDGSLLSLYVTDTYSYCNKAWIKTHI